MGSFLNVVAHRSLEGRPWWGSERSACESCGRVLSSAELVPIVYGMPSRELMEAEARDEVVLGHAGELHPKVIKAFGLPERACAVEFDLDAMIAAAPRGGEVAPISPFPLTKQDVALVVDYDVPASLVRQALVDGAGELLESIRLFDIYTGPQIADGKKSLAFALGFRAPDRTLTEAEAAKSRQPAVDRATAVCGAVQRA